MGGEGYLFTRAIQGIITNHAGFNGERLMPGQSHQRTPYYYEDAILRVVSACAGKLPNRDAAAPVSPVPAGEPSFAKESQTLGSRHDAFPCFVHVHATRGPLLAMGQPPSLPASQPPRATGVPTAHTVAHSPLCGRRLYGVGIINLGPAIPRMGPRISDHVDP